MSPDAASLRYRTSLEGLIGIATLPGNEVQVLRNGDAIFPAMLDAIAGATVSIDMATFIFRGGIGRRFADALTERAAAGVRVRLLLDAVGAAGSGKDTEAAVAQMRAAGAQVEYFRPIANPRIWETFHRAHRKVLVCDQSVAFTGGVGIADEWRGDARDPSEWRDTHFRLRGPAVDGLFGAFVHNWAETGRPLLDHGIDVFRPQELVGPSPVQVVRSGARTGWGDVSTLVWSLLRLAQHRVRIAAAYFVPDRATLKVLCETAGRGVTVELLVNGPHADKPLSRLATEAQYETLLTAGAHVWAFQPTMLHLKTMLIDGVVASVGSANFNARSFFLDEEVNIVVFDPDIVATLDAHFDDDLTRAGQIDPEQWAGRHRARRALEVLPGFLARHL